MIIGIIMITTITRVILIVMKIRIAMIAIALNQPSTHTTKTKKSFTYLLTTKVEHVTVTYPLQKNA